MQGMPFDGGLYVPDVWPRVDVADVRELNYADLAFEIIYPYCDDSISHEDLRNILNNTYKEFHHPKTAPLVDIGNNKYILELFYGPTFAFKDYALQFLGKLFQFLFNKEGKKVTIIGATSGDTGSAAIDAFKLKSNIDIFILYPHEKISEVQRRQMTTVSESNVHTIAVRGDFDDCQKIIKKIFLDKEVMSKVNISTVNSINWSRIIAQVVYYYWSFLQIPNNINKVNFIVPTGNFGNVFAGNVAKKMGLPIEKLHLVTNENDILHRTISSGEMIIKDLRKTYSPSMDIQISSNFERQLFESLDRDSEKLSLIMNSFNEKRSYKLEANIVDKLKEVYNSYRVTDAEILKIIKLYNDKYNYLADPHTATGLSVLEKNDNRDHPFVSLACAHPVKFSSAIKKAINKEVDYPDSIKNIFENEEKFTILDNNIMDIKNYILNNIE